MSDRTLIRLALPLVVSFTTRFLFQFVDMAFAAEFEGRAAVAAIAYFVQFQTLMMAAWVGLSAGFTASLSDAFGRRDEARIQALKRGMLRILYLVIPALTAFGVGMWFWIPELGLEPDMEHQFRIYGPTVFAGMALTGFWSIHPDSVVKAHQDTRSTMIAGLCSTFTNVGLNALFILGFGMGIGGIALATVLSRFPGLFYAMHRAAVLEATRRARPWDPIEARYPRTPVPAILLMAIPGTFFFVLNGVETVAVYQVLNRADDATTAIASMGVFAQLHRLTLMPVIATSVAVVPFAATLLPRGAAARLWSELHRTLLLLAAVALALGIAIGWVFPETLVRFFLQADPTKDVVDAPPAALDLMRWLPAAALATLPFMILRPVFEAAQRPRLGVRIAAIQCLCLSVPLVVASVWFAPALGLTALEGVLAAILIAGVTASGVALWMVRVLLRERAADGPS